MNPFILICPSTRGLSLALTRHYLCNTTLPIYATHRSKSPDDIRERILGDLPSRSRVDPARLRLLPLELLSEDSIQAGAEKLSSLLPGGSYIHTAFLTAGILHPERQPADLELRNMYESFQLNVIAHMLLVKHFSRFLPPSTAKLPGPARWVHLSARVGSISDNRLGGWYSYRASKAALNQIIRTFDLHLQTKRVPAICIGMHPGTVKTDLSKPFWSGVRADKLFEPDYAAEKIADVVDNLGVESRGKVWDWAGKEVFP